MMHREELTLINQYQYVSVLSMLRLSTFQAVSLTDNFEKVEKENNSPYLHTKVKLITLRTARCEEQIPS